MRYASMLLELSNESVYSVEAVVENARERGLLFSDNEEYSTMRRRAYDSLSKFARKHLGDVCDEVILNRRKVPVPGWLGWRWKLALPDKYHSEPKLYRRLRQLEDCWLEELGTKAKIEALYPPEEALRNAPATPLPTWYACLPGLLVGLLFLILFPIAKHRYDQYQAKQTQAWIEGIGSQSSELKYAQQRIMYAFISSRSLRERVLYFNHIVDMDSELNGAVAGGNREDNLIRLIDSVKLDMHPGK